MIIKHNNLWLRPGWLIYLLLPLLHFASVKLTFLCAATPENVVVIWLPNAVLLAALLRFRGQRGWVLASLTFCSDLIGNLPVFPPVVAALLSLVNLVEVIVTYLLIRRAGVSTGLERMRDLGIFVIAGPLTAALLAGFLGAAVLKLELNVATPYLTLTRLWWFGDSLGLLIYTPLLLAFTQPASDQRRLTMMDALVVLLIVSLASLIFTAHNGTLGAIPLTPTLLLPPILFMAVRFSMRWTTLAISLISLATAWVLTTGHQPFGDVPVHLAIVRAQEFILTLSVVGLGFAILFKELKTYERELEKRVLDRTRELEESNSKLDALSSTDGLTGIANRRRFDTVLAREWDRAKRNRRPLTLIMLDVDLFKQYNDHYGHQMGDDCLRQVARVLEAHALRSGDLVARYGGEEFILIAPEIDPPQAQNLAKAICLSLEKLGMPHEKSPFGLVTCSLGIAVLMPDDDNTPETLIKMVDEALYQAKQMGRNQVVAYQ